MMKNEIKCLMFPGLRQIVFIFLVLSVPSLLWAQTKEVTGTVYGSDKSPLQGVNIIIKGSTRGTTTDAAGKFNIQAQNSDILIFSFTSHETKEQRVGDKTTIDLSARQRHIRS